jgi:hypothetical protein
VRRHVAGSASAYTTSPLGVGTWKRGVLLGLRSYQFFSSWIMREMIGTLSGLLFVGGFDFACFLCSNKIVRKEYEKSLLFKYKS